MSDWLGGYFYYAGLWIIFGLTCSLQYLAMPLRIFCGIPLPGIILIVALRDEAKKQGLCW
jgi:hypothetical protein